MTVHELLAGVEKGSLHIVCGKRRWTCEVHHEVDGKSVVTAIEIRIDNLTEDAEDRIFKIMAKRLAADLQAHSRGEVDITEDWYSGRKNIPIDCTRHGKHA